MNCVNARNQILEGYYDGNLSEYDQHALEHHIHSCIGCLEFSLAVKERAIDPFADVCLATVPSDLWQGIKQTILENGRKRSFISEIIRFFQSQKFCYAVNALVDGVCVAVLAIMFMGNLNTVSAHRRERGAVSSGVYLSAQPDSGYDSVVEKYIL